MTSGLLITELPTAVLQGVLRQWTQRAPGGDAHADTLYSRGAEVLRAELRHRGEPEQ